MFTRLFVCFEDNGALMPQETSEKKAAARTWFGKGGPNLGAKCPGSKDLPAGDPACLHGKIFVITGFPSLWLHCSN